MKKPSANRVLILTAVFNDWESLALLLGKLDKSLGSRFPEMTFEVLALDDGSSVWDPRFLSETSLARIAKVDVLHLKSNLGHQRALAVGLAHVQQDSYRAVVVMDADGEDDPDDVPRLIEAMLETGEKKIIFAERTIRSERLLFRVFYRLYQFLHFCLTGLGVRVGNFSVIPGNRLAALGVLSDMWNHYAATVHKSRLPYGTIRAKRAKRLLGYSSMSFSSLVIHGLSALSVHGELIGTRILAANAILAAASLAFGAAWLAFHWMGNFFVPQHYYRWMFVGGMVLAQGIAFSLFFAFLILRTRASSGFVPARDFQWFVGSVEGIETKRARRQQAS